MLFTSGSTGRPKAVAITHASLVNLLSWTGRAFTTAELGCVPVTASLTFDYSLFEMYPPLAVGGRLVIVENVLALRDQPLAVTMIGTVPAALSPLLDDMAIPASARTIVSGGEALTDELRGPSPGAPPPSPTGEHLWPHRDDCPVLRVRGRTRRRAATLGQAIDGSVVLVMDRFGQPLPAGVPGELWVGGLGVSAGYIANPALTAERFVEADLPDLGRVAMYRTGDRVRMDGGGTFHFLGRLDNQLKVRGMRVEPGDIESTLVGHPAIGATAMPSPMKAPPSCMPPLSRPMGRSISTISGPSPRSCACPAYGASPLPRRQPVPPHSPSKGRPPGARRRLPCRRPPLDLGRAPRRRRAGGRGDPAVALAAFVGGARIGHRQ